MLLLHPSTILPQGIDCEHNDCPDDELIFDLSSGNYYSDTGKTAEVPPIFEGNRYALLINGGKTPDENQPGFYDNLAYIYRVLINKYGWDKADISVCCSDGDDPAPDQSNGDNSNTDLDGDNIPDYSNDARKDTVTAEFNNLVNKVEPGDTVFIFLIDHGGYDVPNTPDVRMALWFPDGGDDPYIHDEELAEYVSDMPQDSVKIILVSACFSGGFADDFADDPNIENVMIATSSSYDQVSGNSFAEWLITALNMGYEADDEGYPPMIYSDVNNDGYATYKEGFDLAYQYRPFHNPQWYDSDELGEAATLFGVLPVVFQVNQTEHFENLDSHSPSDGDGLYEAGEFIELYISINNAGNETAADVSLELVNENPSQYIDIISGTSVIPEIPPGETRANSQPILVKIKDNLPENSSCKLSLRVNDGFYDYGIEYDVWLMLCKDNEVTYFYDDFSAGSPYEWFEDGTGEWSIEGDTYGQYWHCGGDGGSSYTGPLLTTLYSPVIYLSSESINFLEYESKHQLRFGDIGSVDIYDGQDWRNLIILGYEDNSLLWNDFVHILKGFSGIMSQVRFTMESNYYGLGIQGWYLNEVGLGRWGIIISDFYGSYDYVNDQVLLTWECVGEYMIGFNLYRREIVENEIPVGNANSTGYHPAGTGDVQRFTDTSSFNPNRRIYGLTGVKGEEGGGAWGLLNNYIIHYTKRAYIDDTANEGKEYEYKLEVLYNLLPSDSYFTQVSTILPQIYELHQSYPNPAATTANITFSLPRDDTVSLCVYDIKGRLVAKPVDENLAIGLYTIPVDTSSLASGVYFYRLITPNYQKTMKMVIAK